MADHINIAQATGTWVVRRGDDILAKTTRALSLREGPYPGVIYVPRTDISMELLQKTETSTRCPFKGEASYFALSAESGEEPDIAWSYETPLAAVAEIGGHLAFYPDRVTIEAV